MKSPEEKLFENIPITKGYDRFTIAFLEVHDKENELDFLGLSHGECFSSIKTHNTYACYIVDGRWAYYVRFPNETKWEQVY